MSDPSDDDMDKPLTKREAVDVFLTKREAYDVFLTKGEFHDVMKNLFEYLDRKFDAIDKRFLSFGIEMKDWFRLELAQHTGAVDERHRTELSVIDDKFKDLPERVTKLEAAVFPAPPAKRQRRR